MVGYAKIVPTSIVGASSTSIVDTPSIYKYPG